MLAFFGDLINNWHCFWIIIYERKQFTMKTNQVFFVIVLLSFSLLSYAQNAGKFAVEYLVAYQENETKELALIYGENAYNSALMDFASDKEFVEKLKSSLLNEDEKMVVFFDVFQKNSGQIDAEVEFKNLTSSGDEFMWEFGDGTFSTAENPKHTYKKSGFYDVKLTVWSKNGKSDFLKVQNAVCVSNCTKKNKRTEIQADK